MFNQDNAPSVENTAPTSSHSSTDTNSSLADKASQLVEIINSSKSQEEKSEAIWEILQNV